MPHSQLLSNVCYFEHRVKICVKKIKKYNKKIRIQIYTNAFMFGLLESNGIRLRLILILR